MGGGKTYVCLAILMRFCLRYPASRWAVIRENMPVLKKTTLPSFKKLLPGCFLRKYNQQDYVYTFDNDSQIIFMAENYDNDKDFNHFKGLEVNGFLLEQIEELQKGLLDICFIRAGRWKLKNMPKPIILATVNPTQTWVKHDIYLPYHNKTLPKEWFYLSANIIDNPVLSKDNAYMSQFNNLDPLIKERLIEGNWDAFAVEKPFLYCFDEQKHISQKAVYQPNELVYLSFDFNVDPCTCVLWQEGRGWIHYIDEVFLKNSNIYEVCAVIKSKYPHTHFMVTGDATGRSRHHTQKGNRTSYHIIKQELRLKEIQFVLLLANPPISETRTLCNAILANHPQILFHPDNCKNLINDCRFTEVDDRGDISDHVQSGDSTKDKYRGHLLDGFRYSLYNFHRSFIKKGF